MPDEELLPSFEAVVGSRVDSDEISWCEGLTRLGVLRPGNPERLDGELSSGSWSTRERQHFRDKARARWRRTTLRRDCGDGHQWKGQHRHDTVKGSQYGSSTIEQLVLPA
jgi:hypothetical protein